MNRRRLLQACGVGLASLWAGCLSPTLPLPPPDSPDSVQAASAGDLWNVSGECTPGAMVLVRNERTGKIVGTEDQAFKGRYFVQLPAQECDAAVVFHVVDTEVSPGTAFIVQETEGGEPVSDACSPNP